MTVLSNPLRRLAERSRARRLIAPESLPVSDYLERFPGAWHVVRAPEPLGWPAPRRFGLREIEFDLPSATAEFGVLEIQEGRVFGTNGWVIGVNGAVLPELSWYGGEHERIRVPRRLPAPTRLSGRCLSLVSDWSSRNYAHFLLDGLGRLPLFLDAGLTLSEIDHVYCPTPPSPGAAQLLDRFAIPREKRVWAAGGRLVHADVLFVPSLPATSLTYPSWLPQYLRGAVASGIRPSTRRLYVSRRGHGRRVASEDALQPLLLEYGFENYDPAEHADQARDFSEAEVVVGAHGAGLANLAFCQPGARVLELVPTDNVYPFYYSLAVAGGLDYGYLAGASQGERDAGTFGPSPYDFDVDPGELTAALDELTAT
jgi:capsular polysaccharide biosynthesis protein